MMNDLERRFLSAVERGDLETLEQLLNNTDETVDINCLDPLARNALVIAIDNENLEIVKFLIGAGIRTRDALLYAIDDNFVEAVELLMDHSALEDPDFYEDSFFSSDMTPLTLAAHKNNFEIIKILLNSQVSPILYPHDPRCGCKCCRQARADDCLKHSRSRINAYKALASPCLIALSSPDPLLKAFEMSAKLEDLARMEPEYRQEYLKLRSQCQTFATKLLDQTRTSRELEILLNYSDDYPAMRLARLRLAIQCKQKTFCAHPNIQELLATMWYENLPGFRNKSTIRQTFQIICIGLMFPIYSTAYLLAPNTKLGRYIKLPFVKFICHSASYITFLIVLILASQRVAAFYCWSSLIGLFGLQSSSTNNPPDSGSIGSSSSSSSNSLANFTKQFRESTIAPPSANHFADEVDINTLAEFYKQLGVSTSGARGLDNLSKMFFEQIPASSKKRGSSPSPIEVLILIWVISLLWAEIKQIRLLGLNYYKEDMWNILDSIANTFYIGTIILRIISFVQSDEKSVGLAREYWPAYDPLLLSEGLFAAATIFSVLKLVYIFSVNPYLGPLQISVGRMIIDIIRFSWIYVLVLFAFACGMNQLLWYYADLERHQCLNVTNYNLAQYYAAQRSNSEVVNDLPPLTIDDSCKTWRHFSNVFESLQTLFWANFGLVDLENFELTGIRHYTRFWALLMFGCYCFINVIVVLNLLIAMMNHSYVKISKHSDIEWKFARTRLWMSYFDTGSTVPAPFNICPSIKSIRNMLSGTGPITCLVDETATYRNVIRTLVHRYLISEQRLIDKKTLLTEARLNRWAKLNAFD